MLVLVESWKLELGWEQKPKVETGLVHVSVKDGNGTLQQLSHFSGMLFTNQGIPTSPANYLQAVEVMKKPFRRPEGTGRTHEMHADLLRLLPVGQRKASDTLRVNASKKCLVQWRAVAACITMMLARKSCRVFEWTVFLRTSRGRDRIALSVQDDSIGVSTTFESPTKQNNHAQQQLPPSTALYLHTLERMNTLQLSPPFYATCSLSAGLSTPHLYIADVTPSQLSNCPSPTVAVLSSRGSDVTYSSAKREYIPGLGQVSATYGSMAGSGPQFF
ncbi:Large ribosomal subunit protein [Trichinella spiralis]|uniref:Large ribosomal subunit protein n=1 Tax=Trichinella spiralis TaxID=6334 RepID=A0ABR3KK24_TRISP